MKSAGAGAKCDHFKLGVRTRVRARCLRATQKRSQLTPWYYVGVCGKQEVQFREFIEFIN